MTTTTTPTPTAPPLLVTGRRDEHLSRWLWLVKWVLALPHYLVLALLWPVLVVTTAIAGIGILVTGRYPRALFDLNAGILRWTWRVNYYSYGALGTDRYPPFTLRDVPDYPARLEITYPERLSRGLVLVKWWLLALPHYVIVALLIGGWWAVGEPGGDAGDLQLPGLIGLLVLIAGVTLAVSGRYPAGLFDLVLGLNRWVLRVAAYAGLMTDAYPPFRLDMGGTEAPAHTLEVEQRPPEVSGSPPRSSGGGTSTGGTVALVLGALLLLPALSLVAGGVAATWVDQTQRDGSGFVVADATGLSTGGSALVTEPLDLQLHGPEQLYLDDLVGDVRLRVTSQEDAPLFLGVARTADVERYLRGVPYDVVSEVRGSDDVSYAGRSGTGVAEAPDQQDFWLVSDSGVGTLSVTSEPVDGRWTAVVMNADATPGLAVDAEVGATVPPLDWIGGALLVTGAVLATAATVLLVVGARAKA